MRLRSRIDFLLTRRPELYARILLLRRALDPDKLAFLHLVRPGDVVLDVGANLGYYTRLFSNLVGSRGEVHSFEPVPSTFERLVENLESEARFRNVRARCLAVADSAGLVTLHLPGEDHGQASMAYQEAGSWAAGAPVVEHACRAVTLDGYVDEHRLNALDFLKCDVEGAELLVLRGASGILERFHPILHLEVSALWSKGFGYGPPALFEHLARFGYSELLRFHGERWMRSLPEDFDHLEGSANLLALVPTLHRERTAALLSGRKR